MFEGSVDAVTIEKATGWLYDRAEGRTTDVIATLHGRVIGSAPSGLYRPDLEQVGFGDGVCGFDLPFDEPIRDSEVAFVTVQPRGSNLSIPRTSDDSYRDLVMQVARLHPGAGRNRTVLGGLWTDRTDSLQILCGRINTGSCAGVVREPLRHLIAEGQVRVEAAASDLSPGAVAVLDGSLERTDERDSLERYAAELADALMSQRLAPILTAVFDDIPIAYSASRMTGDGSFAQASAFEAFTSPAEVIAVYLPLGSAGAGRIDYIRDSHEFPEFDGTGGSRWTAQGIPTLPMMVAGQEHAIDSVDLIPGQALIVGPGLVHRVGHAASGVLRVLFAPKRNTPLRFLKRDVSWQEVAFGDGMRARLG